MQPLEKTLRNQLERTIKTAREHTSNLSALHQSKKTTRSKKHHKNERKTATCESTQVAVFIMAERGRFELPVACATIDFESITFGLSDTSPQNFS